MLPPQGEQPRRNHDSRADDHIGQQLLAIQEHAKTEDEDQLQIGQRLQRRGFGQVIGPDQQVVPRNRGAAQRQHPAPVATAHRFPEPQARRSDQHSPAQPAPQSPQITVGQDTGSDPAHRDHAADAPIPPSLG